LACDFLVVADCGSFTAALDGMVQRAAQRYPVSRRHRFEVGRSDEGYHLRENGRDLPPQREAWSAASAVFWRMHDLALEALPEFTKVHAGCATWEGKRFVAVGPTRSGKTTLMTRLLYDGFAVHCDDIVLLRRGDVLPYPRRFRIRPPALALLPQVAALAGAVTEDAGSATLDPSELGFAWQIDLAPADVVISLERDRGATRLEAVAKHVMAQRLMAQSQPPAGGPQEWIADVCALLDRSACYALNAGDLDSAAGALKDALTS
jgi:hypothetical protein